MSIKVLPPAVSNQIAAGEVVERPASVVKECVENALDAKADQIEIHLDQGGKTLIQIIDNGHGIDADDLPKAILRHATSKISSSEDLFHLQQYGFRGEALAAVGSISDFTLTSKTKASEEAYTLTGKAGSFSEITITAANDGTMVRVEKLFAPVPARLEYLKSAEAEYRACLKEIYGFALANPRVSFEIYKEGKKTIDYPATEAENRVVQVLKRSRGDMCGVNFSTPDLNITGFTSQPGKGLSNKNQQYILINGRRIEDHRLAYAVREAYVQSAGIEKHLYPAFVLNVKIDPILVDVNVHPRKLEVKFAEPGAVFSAFKTAIINALEAVSYTSSTHQATVAAASANFTTSIAPRSNTAAGNKFNHSLGFSKAPSFSAKHEQRPLATSEQAPFTAAEVARDLQLIGQLEHKYIMAQSADGVYFFDQHALHERQRFEIFWQDYKNTTSLTEQPLLVPETVSLPEDQISLLYQNNLVLAKLGFNLSFIADDAVEVDGVSELLVGQNLKALLTECVRYLENEKIGETAADQIMRKLLEYKACRGAVMFGDKLEPEEMEKLIQDFDRTDWKLLCPHGRPNHHFLPFKELDGYFHR